MRHDRLPSEARSLLATWRGAGETVVFTNGVFDLLHRGHVEYLEEAAALGDRLVEGCRHCSCSRNQTRFLDRRAGSRTDRPYRRR